MCMPKQNRIFWYVSCSIAGCMGLPHSVDVVDCWQALLSIVVCAQGRSQASLQKLPIKLQGSPLTEMVDCLVGHAHLAASGYIQQSSTTPQWQLLYCSNYASSFTFASIMKIIIAILSNTPVNDERMQSSAVFCDCTFQNAVQCTLPAGQNGQATA